MIERPAPSEYAPYFAGYVALVPAADVLEVLAAQPGRLAAMVASLTPEQERHRYAPGKWSVREVLGHVLDTERIFGYRALRIARGDATPLAGFDENVFVAAGGFDDVPAAEWAAEFAEVRSANLRVLRRALPAHAGRAGVADGQPVTVRALAFLLVGHVEHHLRVLAERYGVGG
jgi:hypothetical protein